MKVERSGYFNLTDEDLKRISETDLEEIIDTISYKITNHSGPGYNSLYSGFIVKMFLKDIEVGSIQATICDDHNENTEDSEANHYYYFYIHDLFVEPEFRMKGYASKLIQKIKEFNKTGMIMIVNCNDKSKAIFENNGFSLKQKIYIMEL